MKPIPGFPNYSITNDGQVWSSRRKDTLGRRRKGKWLRTSNSKGYLAVGLTINSHKYTCDVHRLVLETYVGPCPPGKECRHLNGIRTDNRLENLRWGSHRENTQDSKKHGTQVFGEKSGRAKLTEEQVILIFRAYHDGTYSMKELASLFGVSGQHISYIINKKTWKHLWETLLV